MITNVPGSETQQRKIETRTYENFVNFKLSQQDGQSFSIVGFFSTPGVLYRPSTIAPRIPNELPPGFTPRTKLYNVSPWIGISKILASTYTLEGTDVTDICRKNEMAARSANRVDLIQTWRLLQLVTHPSVYQPYVGNYEFDNFDIPWAQHPFGRPLIKSLISHYEKLQDIQTLAMIVCVLCIPSQNAIKTKNMNDRTTAKKAEAKKITKTTHYF
jgi:hypothetical protein